MISPHRLWTSIGLATAVCVCSAVPAFSQDASDDEAIAQTSLTQSEDPLAAQIDEAIEISKRRYLQTDVHSPWQIMHGILALRHDFLVKNEGEKVGAVDWMATGVSFRGEPWFQKTKHGGRAHPFNKAYVFEGHPNQFLAILTLSDLPPDHAFRAGRDTVTIADMVRHAKANINANEEITWTLWALSHYVPHDERWESMFGEEWSVERLVQMQTHDPVNEAACGGTHGLFALSYARNQYLKSGKPLRGVWLEAEQKIQRYIEEARESQNPDGTFSTEFFKGPGSSNDLEKRLGASGHTLEFLVNALPDERLNEEWVRNGVAAVARDLIVHQREAIKCGSLYHALDGLVIYRDRINSLPPELNVQKSNGAEAEQRNQTDDAPDVSLIDDGPVVAPHPILVTPRFRFAARVAVQPR